jgi:hypothetical protein
MADPANPFAFPAPDDNRPSAGYGMTRRDWFAGQALVGFMANTRRPTTLAPDDAAWCYTIANAMLAERAKVPA